MELAQRAVSLVRGELVAWLAAEQLEAEREARVRATLLNEISEQRDAVAPDVVRRAEALGWQIAGWHAALYVHAEDRPVGGRSRSAVGGWGAGRAAVDDALARLADVGLGLGPAVERSDGWVAWLTTAAPPSPGRLRAAVRAVRDELRGVSATEPGLALALGVGSARRDAAGIAQSVAEAHEAALIAAADTDPVAVRVVQDLGASRMLLGWYGSGTFADLSRQVLGPLADLEDPELLGTLEAYLERACSAAHTARVLGVHRNTVAQRIARAEKALGVSLSQPDTRLALQLALRAHRRRS